MHRRWIFPLVSALFLCLPVCARAQAAPGKYVLVTRYKTLEVRRFTSAEGVELPPDFVDFLYAAFRLELPKCPLWEFVIGEGEYVEPADVPTSLIFTGRILEYKMGNAAAGFLTDTIAGRAKLRAEIQLRRRSDNKLLLDKKWTVREPVGSGPNLLARDLARDTGENIRTWLGQ